MPFFLPETPIEVQKPIDSPLVGMLLWMRVFSALGVELEVDLID